jgi:hypothetical protein
MVADEDRIETESLSEHAALEKRAGIELLGGRLVSDLHVLLC